MRRGARLIARRAAAAPAAPDRRRRVLSSASAPTPATPGAGQRCSSRCAASASTATTTSRPRPSAARPRAAGRARTGHRRCRSCVCADTQLALGELAAGSCSAPRAPGASRITGSNGKTTVKTLAAASWRGSAAPTSIRATATTRSACRWRCSMRRTTPTSRCYEMGAGKPGDIAYLTAHRAAARGAGQQHRAGAPGAHGQPAWASPRPRARSTTALPADGIAVINADDAFARVFRAPHRRDRRILRFGLEQPAPMSRARDVQLDAEGVAASRWSRRRARPRSRCRCRAATTCCNALAAAALALAAGAPLADDRRRAARGAAGRRAAGHAPRWPAARC